MNFKKNFKRFFTLSRSAEGFTLVELIVVIAILGILVGVGMPAYSGYIEKANEGVDEHNLAMMNNALVVACVYVGVEPAKAGLTTDDMNWSNDGKTFNGLGTGIATASEGETETTTKDDVVALFNSNLGQPIEFKKYTSADIKLENGAFVGPNGTGGSGSEGGSTVPVTVVENEDGTFTYTAGNLSVTLDSADKTTLSGDNAFSDRGSEALLSDVGMLETYLNGTLLGDDILGEIGASDEFMSAFAGYMGLDKADYEDDDAYWEAYETKLEELTTSNPNALTNGLIMYAASNAAGSTQTDIDNLFTGTVTSNIEVTKDGVRDNAATMANAALAYGMYVSYAQANGIATTDPSNFSKTVNTTEFKNYVVSDEGKADLAAYQAAMNMISENTGNSNVTGSILANGIDGNADLEALMKEIMGS